MPIVAAVIVVAATAADAIPLPSFFGFDWDRVGGWSLFIGLCLLIVIGAFREWWVPGRRHRRVEEAAAEQSKTLSNATETIRELAHANEITKHFFEKAPTRQGEPEP